MTAGWRLPRGLVREQHDPGGEGSRLPQLHVHDPSSLPEQVLPAAQDDRVDRDPVLVDEVVPHQRVDEIGASRCQDVAARLLLQFPDLVEDVAAEQRRVLPLHVLQGLRNHVLRERIDPVGEALVAGRRRPKRRPDLVRHAPQEERVHREDLLDLVALHVVGRVL
jgi:hypothetical protein